MDYFLKLKQYELNGLSIIIDMADEFLDVRDRYADHAELDDIIDRVDTGELEWFILRVRVLVDNLELASAIRGEMLYDNPHKVLTDGSAQELVETSLFAARVRATDLIGKLGQIDLIGKLGQIELL